MSFAHERNSGRQGWIACDPPEHTGYDPFGNILSETSPSNGDQFKHAGMVQDFLLGSLFDNARYFSSSLGRFLAQDPIGFAAGDANLFRYVSNLATSEVDPSGLAGRPPGGWSWPWWDGTIAFAGSIWQSTIGGAIEEGSTVWDNTGQAGMSLPARIYTTGGTIAASYVGVRQLDDAFHDHDAVDGHLQSTTERVVDGVLGTVQIVTTAIGIKKAVNCFPAGTLIGTKSGLRPIESILQGELVWAFDVKRKQWKLCPVDGAFGRLHQGDLVTIEILGECIQSTGDHPFWVIEGDDLANRPTPAHVPADESEGELPGRWVDARDLRPQDRLIRKGEKPIAVLSIVTSLRATIVYNISVRDLHTYAVGVAQVLVHNRPASGGPHGNPPDPPNKPPWKLGGNHSPEQWANKMRKRGWTDQQIGDAIASGQQHPATNLVNPGNGATRYVHPETGRSIVLDEVTGEVIHVGGDGYLY